MYLILVEHRLCYPRLKVHPQNNNHLPSRICFETFLHLVKYNKLFRGRADRCPIFPH